MTIMVSWEEYAETRLDWIGLDMELYSVCFFGQLDMNDFRGGFEVGLSY